MVYSTMAIGLAAKLLVAFMLLIGPYAQTANAGVSGDLSVVAVGHHASAVPDAHSVDHSVLHGADEDAGQGQNHHGGSADDAAQCCDMFCAGSACILPAYGLSAREPVRVTHIIADADVVPGEWVNPHRPPNA